MTLPFALPDWLPWWVPLAVLILVLLYLAAFLVMPFSVFGVKGRLDQIDARLDDIQDEIRSLGLRLPDPDVLPAGLVDVASPPVPPPPPSPAEPPPRARGPGARAEPRLDWPR